MSGEETKNGYALYRAHDAAKKNGNYVVLGQLVDLLRARGLKYREIYEAARGYDPTLTLAEWDEAMAECDDQKAEGP